MLSATRQRLVLPVVLGVVSLALFGRGVAYYWGSGPHDGESSWAWAAFISEPALVLPD